VNRPPAVAIQRHKKLKLTPHPLAFFELARLEREYPELRSKGDKEMICTRYKI